ncbi:MAG: nucleotidyltransferase domain-containing protein [Anaerolineae bacterium]|nr:nucleotidyltransferase domain-containing protein [Anaerolineae bacterium]
MAGFDLNAHRDALAAYFAAVGDVSLAYLFGSFARDEAWAFSDVDIAVLLKPQTGRRACLEARLRIAAEVADIVSTEDVDVLILNEAPPALAYAVLRDGVLLFCRDPETRIDFHVRTVNAYLDFKPILERHERAILESARRGELLDGYNRHRGALERYQRVRERLARTPPPDL